MKRYRAYIDEFGTASLKIKNVEDFNQRYLSLTAVILSHDYVKEYLDHNFKTFKHNFFPAHPDEPVILHLNEIKNRRGVFSVLNSPEIRRNFDEQWLQALQNWNFKLINIAIDKHDHLNKYKSWRYDPYHYCMEILIERFYFFLQENNGEGDFMIESRGTKEDKRLKESFRNHIERGTRFVDAAKLSKVFTSCELKIKSKAMNITGLQIADMLAYSCFHHTLQVYNLNSPNPQHFNAAVIQTISSKFLTKNGLTKGHGVKLLP